MMIVSSASHRRFALFGLAIFDHRARRLAANRTTAVELKVGYGTLSMENKVASEPNFVELEQSTGRRQIVQVTRDRLD